MNKYFKLTNSITFYIPATKNRDKKITSKQFTDRMNEVAGLFCKWYGGANVSLVTGFYALDSGVLVQEKNYKLISFCTDEAKKNNHINLIKLARSKCKEWGQETIGLEINNIFYLID